MKVYKLTDENDQTYGGCQWGENVTHEVDGKSKELCNKHWLHAYSDPILAVMMDPIYRNFGENAHMWEAEAEGKILDDRGLKLGATKLTTVKQIKKPEVTTEQRVRFAILCAKAVYKDKAWNRWANGWLDGTDRSADSAYAARAVADPAYAAARAAIDATTLATAAYATLAAAADAAAAYATLAAAAYATPTDYTAAAAAAVHATAAAADIDLVRLAHKAVRAGQASKGV